MGSSSYDFSGETVIVTGGGSGIGRAVARRFGDAGATVIVADVRAEPKDEGESTPTHEAIREAGGEAEFAETDVSDPEQVDSLVEGAREFGGVDVMVNNAGVYRGAPLVDLDTGTFDDVYRTNARGVFAGCRAAARDMLERGDPGPIVNTASISSEVAQTGHAAYDASKGAVMMVTRVAALELARSGIRVNAVAPGPISTAIGSEGSAGTGEYAELVDVPEVQKGAPMGRSGTPEETAGAYCFLASEDASYVTGHLLYADGGYRIV